MTQIATDSVNLKKRVKRFFDRNNFSRSDLVEFIDGLSTINNILIFGGCIRDIALNGVSNFSSDIDLVFCGSQESLNKSVPVSFQKNKFGGFRGNVGKWQVDIWPIKSTWAFKNEHVKFASNEDLLKTTITNWDAIFYSWNTEKLSYRKDYFQDLCEGYLELVLPQNPNLIGCIVRIIRYFLLKEAKIFSPALSRFLSFHLSNLSDSDIIFYELNSYPQSSYINHRNIALIRDAFIVNNTGFLPTELTTFYKTKDLFDD